MADHEPYVILDIKGLIQHAYHAGKDPEALLEEDGTHVTTASHGFHTFLEFYPVFSEVPPRRIIAVWDGDNSYRRSLFPGYKAKRAAKNKEEKQNKPLQTGEIEKLYAGVKSFMAALGCTQVTVPKTEADDVIKMLCDALAPGPIGVYTVDEDLYQLVDDRVGVAIKRHLDSGHEPTIPANLVALHKSLVGDSSDEYPGVKGLGPKGWEALVADFGLDGMEELRAIVEKRDYPTWQHVHSQLSSHAQIHMINEQFEQWCTMYQLAILHPEICHRTQDREVIKPRWFRRVPSQERLEKALENMGARHLLPEYEKWMFKQEVMIASNESPQMQTFMQHLKDGPICAFDFETFDPLKHQPFNEASRSGRDFVDVLSMETTGVSFCFGDNYQHVLYMPCAHREELDSPENWPKGHLNWAVRYAQASVPLVAHNAVFEMVVSLNDLGLEEMKAPYDTAVQAMHIDEDEPNRLKDLSLRWLNYQQITYDQVLEENNADDMSQLTAEQVLKYGCDDSLVTAHLFDLFWLINKVEGTWDFIRDNEFDFAQEQVKAFLTGVNFDINTIKKLEKEAEETLATSVAELRESLAQHCTGYNEAGATTLFQELWSFKEAQMRAKEDPPTEEELAIKRQEIWEECYFASKYIPYQEIKTAPQIALTPKKTLQPVALALGFDTTPPIEKTTKKFFTEDWFPVADPLADADEGLDPNEDKQTFINLIREVINEKAWKKPEAPAHQQLLEFCAAHLPEADVKVDTVGDELNFDSPKQMQQMLYAKMGLPVRSRSKVDHGSARDKLGLQGSPGTDEKAVAFALAEDVPQNDWRFAALQSYLKAKKASTQLKLFLRPLPLWVHPKDGVVHPQFKNCGTATHRPTGTSPNMLQLTKKDGGRLRSSVRPRKSDHVIVSADFNGQELRITASESEDPNLLDAYIGAQRKDVHSVTGSAIAPTFLRQPAFCQEYEAEDLLGLKKVSYDDFIAWQHSEGGLDKAAKRMRFMAKGVNFLITYLGGYTTLAKNLMIPSDLAKELMENTFKMYPRLQPWQEETIRFARTHGYTETAYGSRRHADNRLFSKDDGIRTRIERQVVNATIQGCAADILKEVMATCYRERVFTDTGAVMIAPVYDELVASVPRETVVEFSLRLKQAMEVTPPGHRVPMLAEFSYGANDWGNLVEVGDNINEEIILSALDKAKAA